MIVLTLNSGSSSLKFGLYRIDDAAPEALLTGAAEGSTVRASKGGKSLPDIILPAASPEDEIGAIRTLLAASKAPAPDAVGHRIVHGGPRLRQHCLIDAGVLRELRDVTALSPLHAPAALKMIGEAREAWPDTPQVACFDTVFHAELPEIARTLPVPLALRDEGVRRYGFHGLSCESIVHQLGRDVPPRLIIAHLGNGASVTAVLNGRSVDTSMGLTPSGGVIMGTRSGDIDPGLLLYLLREKKLDGAALEELIDRHSGMLGVSGLSGDMRLLRAAAPANPAAALAAAMFSMSVAKQIAAMAVSLGGADMLVLTGGIGEHDEVTRATIRRHLALAGILEADDAVRVLPSQEDEQIARHVRITLAGSALDAQ